MDMTGQQLVEFWSWAYKKGLMNENTGRSFAAASKQVLSIEENWEKLDVSSINVDEFIERFKNKRGKKFKPDSLNAYERRFRQALDLFLEYTRDPSTWRFKGQTPSSRKPQKENSQRHSSAFESAGEAIHQGPTAMALVEYPFPLRESCIVRLRLPADLKVGEIERLAAFMRTLAVDFSPHQI